ncbi:MAG: carbon-nitrogen hydrolase family protein [Chloroflexota bacterium]
MIIALASPRVAISFEDGLNKIDRCMMIASEQHAEIICFPEAYLPGLHGVGIDVLHYDQEQQTKLLGSISAKAKSYQIATIMSMANVVGTDHQIAAFVFDSQGKLLGHQAKTQIDPSEDPYYIPGNSRHLFEINGVKLGVAICHEGWRYPETVRWAATRGAKIVFHPMHAGSDDEGVKLTSWGTADAPYYEKAMICRSIENTIYFASVNYALNYQEAATSLITPTGELQAHLPYGEEGVLVQKIDLDKATGLIAYRFKPERY